MRPQPDLLSTFLRAVLAGSLAAGLAASCSDQPEPSFDGPRNVILISLDTLRADAVSFLDPSKQTTPFLARLAEERGVVFERHMVNSNNTLTSHATMLTGLTMMVHKAEDGGTDETRVPLAPEYVTVAERFHDAGFTTVGMTSHRIWLSPEFGMDQGFDEFHCSWTDAESINKRFLRWLDQARPRRMFAFLHYYDAHSESSGPEPYDAPEDLRQRLAPPRPADFTGQVRPEGEAGRTLRASEYLDYYNDHARDFPPGHLEYLHGAYEAGVARLDRDLKELFDQLDRRGILDQSLVVITSDHGEEFKEHHGTLHNQYFDEIMHVPLIIVPPKGTPRPVRRVDQVSRCVDITPTLLDLAGLEPLETSQGRSLRPMLEGRLMDYAETFFGRAVLRFRDEQSEYKICIFPDHPTFFDLERDPGEQADILERPEDMKVYGKRISKGRIRVNEIRRENNLVSAKIDASSGVGPKLNPRQEAELRSLGYIGDGEQESAPPQTP